MGERRVCLSIEIISPTGYVFAMTGTHPPGALGFSLSTGFQNYGHKPWFTTETQSAQREVFVCREIPTNKNIMP
jgi:hypothetical protein